MGETVAETFRDQIEIEKSGDSVFKQSVSFGRFENDLLSWERWSSFSQNKYLEEVGKCSTPGSVAKKKAYFEAHYKKIAARKAEMEGEEHEVGEDLFRSESGINGNGMSNGYGTKLDFDSLDMDGDSGSMESDNNSLPVPAFAQSEEPNQDAIMENFRSAFVDSVREEEGDLPVSPKAMNFEREVSVNDENQFNEPQCPSEEMFELNIDEDNSIGSQVQLEPVSVIAQEGNGSIASQEKSEQSHQLVSEASHAQEDITDDAMSRPQKETYKRTPASNDKNSVKAKKKPVAPATKTTRTLLPRLAKVTPVSPIESASKISTRKSSPSLPKKNSPSSVKKKTSTPNAVHMSLSLEPTTSDSATPVTARRSFIMEKMGDKDIVKRAFRAFQTVSPQVPITKAAQVPSTSTPQKDKERVKKALDNPTTQKRQVGARATSVSTRPVKGVSQNQTTAKTSISSFGLKSDVKEEKRKELSKRLEKPNPKEVERPRLLSQSKDKKEAETRKQTQKLGSKTTPKPDPQRVQRISKIRGNKVVASNEPHPQPESLS
ncbi:hypothetical protein ACHQM5_005900 [Ranunculus cassubicifolius]